MGREARKGILAGGGEGGKGKGAGKGGRRGGSGTAEGRQIGERGGCSEPHSWQSYADC